jgi:NAD(P)-dependent dehydrogenase (short-subunit alcohol dehydrogenase family)|tara:strand:+ start:3195 stop:3962 length:768 start_codon:yes stop_codon:yes gene_type:complete
MKKTSFNLNNKNIIITGGNGFLGSQIVDALLNEGANVYVIDIKKHKKKLAKHFISDITNESELEKILKFFKLRKIKIDVLINNAAVDYAPSKLKKNNLKLETFPNDLWDKDILVSLKGSYLCTKIFGSYMSKFQKGSIINISSDLGIIAPDQRIYNKSNFIKPVTYSVVKHGIIGLTKYTASYWGEKNIRCNAIAPGGIFNNQDNSFVEKINRLIPLGRMAKKKEYNGLILFLCSDLSSYITGSVMVADGGRTII